MEQTQKIITVQHMKNCPCKLLFNQFTRAMIKEPYVKKYVKQKQRYILDILMRTIDKMGNRGTPPPFLDEETLNYLDKTYFFPLEFLHRELSKII